MPPKGSGKNSWVWIMCCPTTFTCLLSKANGEVCGHPEPTKNTGNMASHMKRAHGLDSEDDPAVKARKRELQVQAQNEAELKEQTKLDAYPGMVSTTKTPERIMIEDFCDAYESFRRAESVKFRARCVAMRITTVWSREGMRNLVMAYAEVELTAAIRKLRGVRITLSLDAGTVWRRYLVVCALTLKYPPLIVGVVEDRQLPGGTLTAVNIANYLSSLMADRLKDCNIVGFVADNASNMQKAITLVDPTVVELPKAPEFAIEVADGAAGDAEQVEDVAEAPEEREDADFSDAVQRHLFFSRGQKPSVLQRCFAHSVQLAVRDLLATAPYDEFEERVHELKADPERYPLRHSICKTRWNTIYLVIDEALERHRDVLEDNEDLLKHLEQAKKILKPFYDATMITQGDNTSLWHAALGLEELLKYTRKNGTDPRRVLQCLENRAAFLISPGLLLLAYFVPFVQVTDGEKVVLEALHREAISNMDEAARFAAQDRPITPVLPQGAPPIMISVDMVLNGNPLAQNMKSRELIRDFLNVAPTEAAVERVFSQLKDCITDKRTRTHPGAATAALIFNASSKFLEGKECTTLFEQYQAVPLPTWQWILTTGCKAHAAKIATLVDLNAAAFVLSASRRRPQPADLPDDDDAARGVEAAGRTRPRRADLPDDDDAARGVESASRKRRRDSADAAAGDTRSKANAAAAVASAKNDGEPWQEVEQKCGSCLVLHKPRSVRGLPPMQGETCDVCDKWFCYESTADVQVYAASAQLEPYRCAKCTRRRALQSLQ